jgi:hypothetical protein
VAGRRCDEPDALIPIKWFRIELIADSVLIAKHQALSPHTRWPGGIAPDRLMACDAGFFIAQMMVSRANPAGAKIISLT